MAYTNRRTFAKISAALIACPSWSGALPNPLNKGSVQTAPADMPLLTSAQMTEYLHMRGRFESSQRLLRDFALKFDTAPDFIFRAVL
jgi:hypothetical protein